jgi:hypothetical protein
MRPGPTTAEVVKLDELYALVPAGQHAVALGKSEPYSVAGDNADLRHYLARLGSKSRCFSRSLAALAQQLFTWRFPKLEAHFIDFLPALK